MVPCPFVGVFGKVILSLLDFTYFTHVKARKTYGRWGEDVRSVLITIRFCLFCRFAIRREGSPLPSFYRILLLDSGAGW